MSEFKKNATKTADNESPTTGLPGKGFSLINLISAVCIFSGFIECALN